MRRVGLKRLPVLADVRWLRLFAVVVAAPYACGLGVNGLGEFADADSGADAAEVDTVPNGDDAGADAESPTGNDASSVIADCPLGVTACISSSPDCMRSCGPELSDGGTLGSMICSCNASASVYQCVGCAYATPLPPCYALAPSPPTCSAKAANGVPCTKACDVANPSATPPCAFVTSNGSVEGCQCIQKAGATKPAWTCASRW